MALATEETFDVEAFAMRCARLAQEHAERDETEARMRSATAMQRWGVKVPQPLRLTIDDVIARYRTSWLRYAERLIQVLDWPAFQGRTFHALDFSEIGVDPDCGMLGFAANDQLHLLAADLLPARVTTKPAAAVAINTARIAHVVGRPEVDDPEDEAVWVGRVVGAVAVHEYSHHLDAAAAGGQPTNFGSLRRIVDSVAARTTKPVYNAGHHGPRWVRAYAHLLHRGRSLAGHKPRAALFEIDIDDRLPGQADAVLAALSDELNAAGSGDVPLVDILRTPAPAGFLELFNETTTAAPAA